MKTLELLKRLRDEYIHGELDSDINEAISELEQLKNRSCEDCKYFQNKIDEYEIACDFICGFFDMNNQKYCGAWESR